MDYQHNLPETPANYPYTKVFDLVDIGMCITDSNGTFTYVNSACCELLGYLPNEMIGRPLTMIIASEHRSVWEQDYHRIGGPEVNVPHEYKMIRKDGTLLDVSFTGTGVPGSTGRLSQISTIVETGSRARSETSLRRFGQIFDQTPNEIYIFPVHPFVLVGANRQAEANLGYSNAELLQLTPFDVMESITSSEFDRLVSPLMDGSKKRVAFECEHRRKDGTTYSVQTSLQYLADENPPVFVAISNDISGRRKAETWARLLEKIIDSSNDGILVTDAANTVLFLNQGFSEITGYTSGDLVGRDTSFLKNDFNPPDYQQRIEDALRTLGTWTDEIWGVRKNGVSYAQRLSVSKVTDDSGNLTNYIYSIEDITEQRHVQERMRHLAYYDTLTDLPNRTYFNERIARALTLAEQSGTYVAILFANLERFRNINKTFGQLSGDNLLRMVADRFREVFPNADSISHFGGDEFVVLLESVPNIREVQLAAETALLYLNKPYEINDFVIYASARIGISMFPEHGKTAEMLLRNAEAALNDVVQGAGAHVAFYSTGLNARAIERMKIENGLRTAIARQELFLHFQPQIDVRTGNVCGAEALLRWHSDRRGLIPPSEFIPVAEDTGLIVPIGEWVLRTACAQFSDWKNRLGPKNLRIAVNISAHQFARSGLVRFVESIIRSAEIDPSLLELEITESAVMRNVDEAIRTLKELKNLGITIAVDDFGTGYSSLSYLRRLPIDRLKIDRSFVTDISRDAANDSIIDAIIALARGLSLEVIAEGVETPGQVDFLKKRGCEIAQGYFYSHPLSPDAFIEFVVDHTLIGSAPDALRR
ncbi:MAG TPA: EAL domain-containing protein [Spirochaetia bacterium]|nr:EAL domain-containing protein [Spirochaetia bacterium]